MKKKLLTFILATSLIVTIFPNVMPDSSNIVSAASTGEIVKSVNFRTQPSTSGERIRYLQRGERVDIIEKVNSYWYKVRDRNGRVGYVSTQSQYIKVSSTASNSSNAGQATIVSSVSFRTGPSTSNSRIRYLQRGENVTILRQVNSYWYEVRDRNGRTGYVSTNSKYISVNNSSPQVSTTNATIVAGVNFRTGPSTSSSRIRYLQKGEKVTILRQVNSYWYEVRDRNGRTGYVSTSSKYISTSYSGGSTSAPAPSNPGNTSAVINRVIQAGKKYLGTPYEFGSNRSSTATFDCSAFVRRAFMDGAGITLPSDSRKQGDYVKNKGNTTTNWRNLKVGDLMFFMSYKGTSKSAYSGINKNNQRITHVGIYLGNGQILHTYSKQSGGVRIDNIQGRHWEYRFMFGGSAL